MMKVFNAPTYLTALFLSLSLSPLEAIADTELAGSAAIEALSGRNMVCKWSGKRVELEWAEATDNNSRVKYSGYFNGNRVQGEFIALESGDIVRAEGRLSRRIERIDAETLRMSGDKLPTSICK